MKRYRRLLTLLPGIIGWFFLSSCSSAAEPLFSKRGTGTILHPLQKPKCIEYPPGFFESQANCRMNKVHIFGVNGLNPMCLGNFNGFCEYLKEQGFTNTYFGQLYTSHTFIEKIKGIRKCDPDAKIVLIGYSLGADNVRNLANKLCEQGVTVDLLMYMVGDLIKNEPRSWPPNVAQVVNIRSKGIILFLRLIDGQDIDGARNYMLDKRHILIPSREETMQLVMRELLAFTMNSFPQAPLEKSTEVLPTKGETPEPR